MACSEDLVADMGSAIFVALQEWHSSLHPQTSFPPPPDNIANLVLATAEMVLSAIKSFANASAGPVNQMVNDPYTSRT